LSSGAKIITGVLVVVAVLCAAANVVLIRTVQSDRAELAETRQQLEAANQQLAAQAAASDPANQWAVLQTELDAAKQQVIAVKQQLTDKQRQLGAALAAEQKAEDRYNLELQMHQQDNRNLASGVAETMRKLNSAQLTIARLSAENTRLQAAANDNAPTPASSADKSQNQVQNGN